MWREVLLWKIQVTESMLSGLCRKQLLQQKWLAYKSSLVSIEILAPKSSDANQGRAPRETIEKKLPRLASILAPKVAWIWRGSFPKHLFGLFLTFYLARQK